LQLLALVHAGGTKEREQQARETSVGAAAGTRNERGCRSRHARETE